MIDATRHGGYDGRKEKEMAKRAIVFEAERSGYSIDQIDAITVGELREFLEGIEDDVLFVLSHDRGYTYGSVDIRTEVTTFEEHDGEWEETDW